MQRGDFGPRNNNACRVPTEILDTHGLPQQHHLSDSHKRAAISFSLKISRALFLEGCHAFWEIAGLEGLALTGRLEP